MPGAQQDVLDSVTGLLTAVPGMIARFWAVEVGLAVGLWLIMNLEAGAASPMKRFLPFLILGPLTGPLAFGLVGCLRTGRLAMARVYAAGMAEVWWACRPCWRG